MRVLLTNRSLVFRAGSELYLSELAGRLLARGHSPIAYSPRLGPVAEALRAATIPVVDRLDAIGEPPDLIHGQHHLETLTALLHFSGVPAVHVCHGWVPWEEVPPRFPRILRYVAVDFTTRERLVSEQGIPPERVEVILNFVDLERFRPRDPCRQRHGGPWSSATRRATAPSSPRCARPARGSVSPWTWPVQSQGPPQTGRRSCCPATTSSSPRRGRPSKPWPWAPRWCSATRPARVPW
ncbi:MAG TPA: glycosyltransferase family 4 protein [Thermoanaerobaculia bacterium]